MGVSAPYASVAEYRAFSGEPDDPTRSGTIEAALLTASEMVATFCGRDLSPATVTETYEGLGTPTIFVARPPITSVASVIYESATISVVPDTIGITRADGQIFARGRRVEVTYTAGYPTMPRDVVLATCITAKAVLSAPIVNPNLMSESVAGVTSFSVDIYGAGALPRAARSLLNDYVVRYGTTLR